MIWCFSINPDLRSVIYTAGIKYGRESEWTFLWQQYKTAIVPTEKKEMLTALTTTMDLRLLSK